MMKRLLIAVPVAAGVVAALFWAMSSLVPVGRPRADYTVIISPHGVTLGRTDMGPIRPPPRPRHVQPPDEDEATVYRRLPLPPRMPPERGKPQSLPHKRFPPPKPKLTKPELLGWVMDDCYPFRHGPFHFPKAAHDGDQVTVEYTILADGTVENVKVISSTNPEVDDEVVSMVQRWRWVSPAACKGQAEAEIKRRRVRTRIELRRPDLKKEGKGSVDRQ